MATVNNNDIISKARQEITSSIAYQRLALLFDDGSFTELSAFSKSSDTYAEVIAGYGVVNGCPVYAFAQNSEFALRSVSSSGESKSAGRQLIGASSPIIFLRKSSSIFIGVVPYFPATKSLNSFVHIL